MNADFLDESLTNQSRYAPLNSFSIQISKTTKSKMTYKTNNDKNDISNVGQGYVSFDADQSHDISVKKVVKPEIGPMKGIKVTNSRLRLDESNPSPIRPSRD
jgi:hypothetical protein